MRLVGFIVAVLILGGLIWGLWWLRLHAVVQSPPQTVTIENFSFNPSNLEIAKGTEVTFTNKDQTAHTVTSNDGSFNSGNLGNGQSFKYSFDKTGTFYYHCSIHPNMQGQITVK